MTFQPGFRKKNFSGSHPPVSAIGFPHPGTPLQGRNPYHAASYTNVPSGYYPKPLHLNHFLTTHFR